MIDYRHSQGIPYKPEIDRHVCLTLVVCEYLIGTPWDEISLAAVSTVRPSVLRVCDPDSLPTDDGWNGRVTVHVDANNIIRCVEHETTAFVTTEIKHGHDLHTRFARALD